MTREISIEHADLLRGKGLRVTSQRLELLLILGKTKKPMGIAQLQEKYGSTSMNTATFYRGLETLAEVGIVRKIDLRHGHTDYELSDAEGHHHHLVCQGCGKIEDIDWCPTPSFKKKILKGSGFKSLTEHSAEFFGLCNACA